MESTVYKYCLVFVVCLSVTLHVVDASVTEEKMPDGQTKMKIKAPILSDEEVDSDFMPQHMICDGCKAVAFQLFMGLAKAEMKLGKKAKFLPESEVLEVFENVCDSKSFESYTLKDVDGTNMLSGPGIEKNAKGPTMMQGGGRWPSRLSNICGDFIDRLGEDDIYENFRQEDRNSQVETFFNYLCYGPSSGGRFCKKDEGDKDDKKGDKKEEL